MRFKHDCDVKNEERKIIEKKIRAFKKAGGKITKVPTNFEVPTKSKGFKWASNNMTIVNK